jgi:hypothetical protein
MFLKNCMKINTLFTFNQFFPEIRAINEIMWEKQKYNVAFPMQQLLRERTIILR